MTSRSAGLQALMDGQTRRAIVNPSGVNLEALEARVVALEGQMHKNPPTFKFARRNSQIDDILGTVSQYYGITRQELLKKGKQGNASERRYIAMKMARSHTRMSSKAIGRSMGLHHTAILAGAKAFERFAHQDDQYRAAYGAIEEVLRAKWGTNA